MHLAKSERPGHSATTANIQAAYPFVADGGLGGRGVYIGRDAYGGSFVFDPLELYGRGVTLPNKVGIGQIGGGETSVVKSFPLRQASIGRRGLLVVYTGVYAGLAAGYG